MLDISGNPGKATQIKTLQYAVSIMGQTEENSDEYIVARAAYNVIFNSLRNNTELQSSDILRHAGLDSSNYKLNGGKS